MSTLCFATQFSIFAYDPERPGSRSPPSFPLLICTRSGLDLKWFPFCPFIFFLETLWGPEATFRAIVPFTSLVEGRRD